MSGRDESTVGPATTPSGWFKRYAYAWITLAFFLVSFGLHWWFGWKAYLNDQAQHGASPDINGYLVEMARDTFENWQSEFLQLLWQVVGLAYFLYIGSPSSKENDDRMEAKIDALVRLVGRRRAPPSSRRSTSGTFGPGGHPQPHAHQDTLRRP
ncbi:DUF6766 family protein [Neoroseomonas terrae]|uniref:DUF6766 family protein n=1 Tax=Neoroseomonas terrae TaxID=424799 RepID=UPI001BA67D9A|nr:DUF6766 family protein [Neoroseomonas terrae]